MNLRVPDQPDQPDQPYLPYPPDLPYLPCMNDIIVVGAGIAGLAAAFELQRRGLRPLVLEQSARAGGVITTDRIGGYVIDGGPDSLLTQKLGATDVIRELGLELRFTATLPPRA